MSAHRQAGSQAGRRARAMMAEVRRTFGLRGRRPPPLRAMARLPAPGRIVLIVGPSGAGKSRLLRHMQRRCRRRAVDLDRLRLPDRPLVGLLGDDLARTLAMLSQVGLAEAWLWLARPAQLSDGQRWRLRLALALHRLRRGHGGGVIFADEFASLLDELSSALAARALRRAVSGDVAAVVASPRDDLLPALRPDCVVRLRF